MRSLIVTLVALTSQAALADKLAPIDASKVPGACASLAEVPADAKIDKPAFEARISTAHCAASAKMSGLTGIADDDAGMAAVQGAIASSLAMLDELIKSDSVQYDGR
jgi:hypothetical protein